MTFAKFLQRPDAPSMRAISRETGIAMTTLLDLKNGLYLQRVKTARRLSSAIGGALTVAELMGLTRKEREVHK